jgi:hypothetical protein
MCSVTAIKAKTLENKIPIVNNSNMQRPHRYPTLSKRWAGIQWAGTGLFRPLVAGLKMAVAYFGARSMKAVS